MTIAAGCDVGSLTSKAVVMNNRRVLGAAIIRSGPKPAESAARVMAAVFEQTGLAQKDVDFCVGTGYGREKIAFVDQAISEISCHAKGAKWLVPSTRTIFDIGGQDCKVIKLDPQGNLEKFVTNDKCASGTGRFLDVMAQVMNMEVSELGTLAAKSDAPVTFASVCTVFAQADVIKLINARRQFVVCVLKSLLHLHTFGNILGRADDLPGRSIWHTLKHFIACQPPIPFTTFCFHTKLDDDSIVISGDNNPMLKLFNVAAHIIRVK